MNLKPDREDHVELNLTPLIDVVFLLLIFFMVSTTFEKQANLKVQLPDSSVQAKAPENKSIVIGIDAKGHYYINDRQIVNTSIETLKTALKQVSAGKTDLHVTLRADAKTPHQSVVTAMDAAGQLGLVKLSIATMQSQ
ncbi:MAG: biopolymer transporter ExbD [Gammaproteobacteria bacterium]|nr:biopolymer transporter ExbD [Gammaproteobacteria bacterium]